MALATARYVGGPESVATGERANGLPQARIGSYSSRNFTTRDSSAPFQKKSLESRNTVARLSSIRCRRVRVSVEMPEYTATGVFASVDRRRVFRRAQVGRLASKVAICALAKACRPSSSSSSMLSLRRTAAAICASVTNPPPTTPTPPTAATTPRPISSARRPLFMMRRLPVSDPRPKVTMPIS
jgi:hypothetical protein